IRGAVIATTGIGLTLYSGDVWFTINGTMVLAIGEMMSSATVRSFIALITPKRKEGLCQGTYFLPVAPSYVVTRFSSGGLYQSWSDKLSLLKREMAGRNIEMPEVVTNEEFIEQGSKALNMSISNFETQFNLKAESVDWNTVAQSFRDFAASKSIDVSQ